MMTKERLEGINYLADRLRLLFNLEIDDRQQRECNEKLWDILLHEEKYAYAMFEKEAMEEERAYEQSRRA